MLFDADEFDRETMTLTGTREVYMADTAEDAAMMCRYTRRLSNGGAYLGPTQRVVYTENRVWVITRGVERGM